MAEIQWFNPDNRSLISVEAGEFSWSYTRHKIFNFCRRAYFYRYYAAQKGWDKFADPRSQLIYRLKNLIKAENWVRNIVSKALLDLFLLRNKNREAFPLRDFYSGLRKNLFAGKADLENGEWKNDPKKLNLFETYYGEKPDAVFEQIREKINDVVSKLFQSRLLSELSAVPYLQWKLFKPPFVFSLDNLKVWTAPDFIWAEEASINILFLRLRKDEENNGSWRTASSVSVMAVENKSHVHLSRIRCRTFFCEKPEMLEGYEDLERISSLVRESSSSMLSMLGPDGKAHEESFSRTENNCAYCEFKEYCGKI